MTMSETNSKRRTEITIETYNLTIIRTTGAQSDAVFCRRCQTKAAVFPLTQASLIFGVSAAELERLLQIDLIHLAVADAFCGNSLAEFFKKEIRYVED